MQKQKRMKQRRQKWCEQKRRDQKQNWHLQAVLIALLFDIALFLLSWPALYNSLARVRRFERLSERLRETIVFSPEKKEMRQTEKARAIEYNEKIWAEQKKEFTGFSGDTADLKDDEYQSLLRETGEGIMAYLVIPGIDLILPVFHGTHAEEMEHGLGHLYGTSLPVGTKKSNVVLAGHSGEHAVRLFGDLDRVLEGDAIYLMTLGELHCYRVHDIRVVPIYQDVPFLRAGQEDVLTLCTCTPKGINDHRLLVRCVKDPVATKESENEGSVLIDSVLEYIMQKRVESCLQTLSLFYFLIFAGLFLRHILWGRGTKN